MPTAQRISGVTLKSGSHEQVLKYKCEPSPITIKTMLKDSTRNLVRHVESLRMFPLIKYRPSKYDSYHYQYQNVKNSQLEI